MFIINGLIFTFVLINLGMLIMCCYCHFDFPTTAHVITTLYRRFFYKTTIVFKNIFKHPIILMKYIFKKCVSLVMYIFSFLVYPGHVLGTYPVITELIVGYSLLLLLGFHFIIRVVGTIAIFIILTIVSAKSTQKFYDKISPSVFSFWELSCVWYKTYENLASSEYEKLMGSTVSDKIDPTIFAAQKVTNYRDSLKEVEKSHQTISEKKMVHKLSYLDVLYPNELAVFNFYMKDFTLDDLKTKKKELLKINHSDNFFDKKEIQAANNKCQEITAAYTALYHELTKQKEA